MRKLILLIAMINLSGLLFAQYSRQQILEQRKAMSVNKSGLSLQSNIKSISRLLGSNQKLCDFTVTAVDAATNPLSQIIQSLVGSGITVSNIQSNLPSTSDIYGSFSCGSAAKLGMESGLILTTGSIDSAKGSNNSPDAGRDNLLSGYSLLNAIANGTGFDASWVSFDIVSNTDSIKFDYVFASEEYKEFVGTQFNDVFGFFISGPGITGTQNLAVLPNSTTPVSINSINNVNSSQYYIDNDYDDPQLADATRFANLAYDGLTTVLTARAHVNPGQTYTLILAIEDVADGIYDAGVFIKGGSITGCNTTVTPSVIIAANPNGAICTGTNVTFTATPTNGGAAPGYQWKLNGSNVGTNSNTYQSSTLANGDKVTVVITSNAPCANPTTATSNEITMMVTGPVTPSVSIAAAPGNTICTGTNVTFTATPTNGGTPSYQWKVNGVNAGTNSNTFQSSTLANSDVVTVVMTSSLACANPTTATSNSITMVVTGTVAPSVSIAAAPGNTICTRTNVTFTATPTNGGTPAYQWKVNGVNAGTNSSTFQSSTLANGDVVTVVMTSSLGCASPTTATSNSITMVVTGTVAPSVSIAAAPGNTICTGTNVSFTATPTNGGTPSYQWKVNGVNAGTNSNTFQSSTLANGDVVTVVMTSSLACASPTTATSNSITMVVTGTVAPSVSIATAPGNTICTGTNVSFTATPTNGGTPSYQWKVNGVNAGTNSNTFQSSTLANGDVVTVVMTSSLGCASPITATSNSITMVVTGTVAPSVSIAAAPGNTICTGTNVSFTATQTNGGTPSYQWKVNGVNAGTNNNTFQSSTLANGDAVTVVMTSSLACANPATATSNSITMVVTGTVAPSVGIAAAPGNAICAGTNVSFTATPINGGTPSYQWKVNGVNAGTNSNTFQSSTLANGDIVTVVMTSSLVCANPTTATSNEITMTVSANVSAGTVSGTSPLCIGQTETYSSNGAGGGSWSSSNTSVASVNSSTGVVSALSAGTTNIVYTVTGTCNPVSASTILTVNPNVYVGVVNGVTPLTVGTTAIYSSTGTAGGSWSSANSGIATVNASTGIVTAVSAGTTNITYTVSSGCGAPVSAFQTLTVMNNSGGIVPCGPKGDKVVVCHNGIELCIALAALPAHLGHGDISGHCPASKTIVRNEPESEPVNKLIVTAYPNPYETVFKLNITSPVSGMATIEFYTIDGVRIYEMRQYVIASKTIVADVKSINSFRPGIIYKVSIGKYQTHGIVLRPE